MRRQKGCYPFVAAVSGVKNSGKTTFLEGLITELKRRGYQIAVIKHDGHEFSMDVPHTDTWRLQKAGALGTAVFSSGQWMAARYQTGITERDLMRLFPEADVILLEGFKHSPYPKFEIVRKGNSKESVCDASHLLALVTDTELILEGVPVLSLNAYREAADILEKTEQTSVFIE